MGLFGDDFLSDLGGKLEGLGKQVAQSGSDFVAAKAAKLLAPNVNRDIANPNAVSSASISDITGGKIPSMGQGALMVAAGAIILFFVLRRR